VPRVAHLDAVDERSDAVEIVADPLTDALVVSARRRPAVGVVQLFEASIRTSRIDVVAFDGAMEAACRFVEVMDRARETAIAAVASIVAPIDPSLQLLRCVLKPMR
jgi:hypothetical protein